VISMGSTPLKIAYSRAARSCEASEPFAGWSMSLLPSCTGTSTCSRFQTDEVVGTSTASIAGPRSFLHSGKPAFWRAYSSTGPNRKGTPSR
jgi:hypothetical protein